MVQIARRNGTLRRAGVCHGRDGEGCGGTVKQFLFYASTHPNNNLTFQVLVFTSLQ